jgi:hypothetical protein
MLLRSAMRRCLKIAGGMEEIKAGLAHPRGPIERDFA